MDFLLRLVPDVDSYIKTVVIPIGMVLAAPVAIGLHAIDILIYLATVVAVSCGVPIDAGAIGLQLSPAVVPSVSQCHMGR